MDSKNKFIKNRYWKRKYRPRNDTTTPNVKKSAENKNEFALKQRIPKKGWFVEYDSSSSSDFEDFESLANVSSSISTSTSTQPIDNDKSHDKNWFDKELDNIQLNSKLSVIEKDQTLKENENKQKLISQQFLRIKVSDSKIENKRKDCTIIDNEEEELEFLLSLKEPVYTGPIIVKNIENERKLTTYSSSYIAQQPVKSIDLEKWLDSVLDS